MTVHVREYLVEELPGDELAALARMETAVIHEVGPTEPVATEHWVRVLFGTEFGMQRMRQLMATDGTDVLGVCEVELDESGSNDDLVFLSLVVVPEARRRGVGTALARAAIAIAEEEGRTSVATWGLDSPEQAGFWIGLGLERKYEEIESRLSIDQLDLGLMQRWVAQAESARQQGYRLVTWRGACPDEHLHILVGALAGMHDAPVEDLDVNHETWTPEAVRRREQHFLGLGTTPWQALVIDPTGAPAAMTEILVHQARPSLIWQEATTTLSGHRNRGLGRWAKATIAIAVANDAPEAKWIATENAGSNAAMLKINTDMGFSPYVTKSAYQGPRSVVSERLRAAK